MSTHVLSFSETMVCFCRTRIASFLAVCALSVVSVTGETAEVYRVGPVGQTCTTSNCKCLARAVCELSSGLIARLLPGDVVRLEPGFYDPLLIKGVRGAPFAPIVFEGVSSVQGEPTVVFDGAGTAKDVLELKDSAFVEFHGVSIIRAQRAGFRINNSHNIAIRGSLLRNNGVWGVFANHANQVIASGNRILGPGQQHGIYLSNSGDGGLIDGNYIAGFSGSGIQLNGDKRMGGADGVIGDGVIEDIEILNNYIAENGESGGAAINLDGARNTSIRDNIILNNYSASVSMFRSDGAVASRETELSGNLVVGAASARSLFIFGFGAADQLLVDNVIIGLNPEAALFKFESEIAQSLFERIKGEYDVPATFISNYYAYAGSLVTFEHDGNASEVNVMNEWIELSGDSGSQLLDDNAHSLIAPESGNRYRRLAQLITELGLLNENRYSAMLLGDKSAR